VFGAEQQAGLKGPPLRLRSGLLTAGKIGLRYILAMAATAPILNALPGKSLFRIGEVSRITATKAFVLRYWESEFPTLQPVKSPSGHRLYRREDIETVFEIKRLLYDEGFTIAGARKHLADVEAGGAGLKAENSAHTQGAAAGPAPARVALSGPPQASVSATRAHRKLLLDLREELGAILTLLKSE
jgi:DNA-binding transcriptional MerR regulator